MHTSISVLEIGMHLQLPSTVGDPNAPLEHQFLAHSRRIKLRAEFGQTGRDDCVIVEHILDQTGGHETSYAEEIHRIAP
jgi:hypothetical protein